MTLGLVRYMAVLPSWLICAGGCHVCALLAFPACSLLHVLALTCYAANADFCDDNVALSALQKVHAHISLQKAPRAVFKVLTSCSLILVNCMCCLL